MKVVSLVPKVEEEAGISAKTQEVLDWLDMAKEDAVRLGVESIAIAYVGSNHETGTGYISYTPTTLLGSLLILQREILNSEIE